MSQENDYLPAWVVGGGLFLFFAVIAAIRSVRGPEPTSPTSSPAAVRYEATNDLVKAGVEPKVAKNFVRAVEIEQEGRQIEDQMVRQGVDRGDANAFMQELNRAQREWEQGRK